MSPDLLMEIVARLDRIDQKLEQRPIKTSVWLLANEAAAYTGGSTKAFTMWAKRHGLKQARNRWSRLDIDAAMRLEQERKA